MISVFNVYEKVKKKERKKRKEQSKEQENKKRRKEDVSYVVDQYEDSKYKKEDGLMTNNGDCDKYLFVLRYTLPHY